MKHLICIAIACLCCASLSAQTTEADTLARLSIPDVMPESIYVVQSPAIEQGFDLYRAENSRKPYNGYRVRIFYSNNQNARRNAEVAVNDFRVMFPDTRYYFEFDNPYFKVTVGDYASKTAAERALKIFRAQFENAIVVKQKFRFPTER